METFASIMPQVKLPRSYDVFDYLIPDNLLQNIRFGSLVLVQWRNKNTLGLVTKVHQQKDFRIKKYKPILAELPGYFLPEELIKTVEWMACEYITSPSSILYALFPNNIAKPKFTIPPAVLPTAKTENNPQISFESYHTFDDKIKIISKLVTEKNKPTLIIVPHLEDVDLLMSKIKSKKTIAIDGQISETEYRDIFFDIINGKYNCVVGTRLAVLAPLPNLARVIVFETNSIDHKQYDQNPRYDARIVARFRAKSANADFTIISTVVRVEDLPLLENQTTSLKHENEDDKKNGVTVITMPKSSQNNIDLIISHQAMESAFETLGNEQSVLFLFNRLGEAKYLLCQNCKFTPICSNCQSRLAVKDITILRCPRCQNTQTAFEVCPNCHVSNLKNIGLGISTLEKHFQKEFTNFETIKISSDKQTVILPEKPTIMIATTKIIHQIVEENCVAKVGLVVIVDVDQLIIGAGFRNTEKSWQLIRNLKSVLAPNNGQLIIQTNNGEKEAITTMLKNSQEFLKNETATRKQLGYPPFGVVMAISIRKSPGHNFNVDATWLINNIQSLNCDVMIAGPLKPRHNRDGLIIILKTKTIDLKLQNLLKSLPDRFIIDVNPEEA